MLSKLLSSAGIISLVFQPIFAIAQENLPNNPSVVAGNINISSPSLNSLLVDQSSGSGIINWEGFSIGAGNSVLFNNGSGETLNRVTGSDFSSIYGNLSATGSVYLINQNGIVFGSTGVINAGGDFVGSTLGVSNSDFLNGGDTTFAGSSIASIVNLGSISSLGGDVSLLAQTISNSGTISAGNGAVSLVAGSEILMHDASLDSGKFLVQVGSSGSSVTEQGAIEAATIELKANGGNIYALAGNTDGMMRATGVSNAGGRIFLTAGDTGSVTIEKSLKAVKTDGLGGSVNITAGIIDVSGEIDVSSVGGDGGSVYIFSEDRSKFTGSINASGNGSEGTGGFVEVSSHKVVNITGEVNGGLGGTFIIDPETIKINGTGEGTDLNTSYIRAGLITETLELGTNVTIWTQSSKTGRNSGYGVFNRHQEGDIIIVSALKYSGSGNLTMLAMGDIFVESSILNSHASAGDITLIAGWDGTTGLPAASGNMNMKASAFSLTAFESATLSNSTVFGNTMYGGNVHIGSYSAGHPFPTAFAGTAVGSRSGNTRVYANDLALDATQISIKNGAAVLGFVSENTSSDYAVDGDIKVRTTGKVNFHSGPYNTYVGNFTQIGHMGGIYFSGNNWNEDTPVFEANIGGDIVVEANGAIKINSSGVMNYATIGHGGLNFTFGDGVVTGDITVTAGSITLSGVVDPMPTHAAAMSWATIGHSLGAGGASGAHISVTATGNIGLTGGGNGDSWSQIGHMRTAGSSAPVHFSNITVSGQGITLTGGSNTRSYAKIGHGTENLIDFYGFTEVLNSNISVTASGTLTMIDGSGSSAEAVIKHRAKNTLRANDVTLKAKDFSNTTSTGLLVDYVDPNWIDSTLQGGNATIISTGSALVLTGTINLSSTYDLVVEASGDLTLGSSGGDWSFTNKGGGRVALASVEGNFIQTAGSEAATSITLASGSYWQIYSGLYSLNAPITDAAGLQGQAYDPANPFNATATGLMANTHLYRQSDQKTVTISSVVDVVGPGDDADGNGVSDLESDADEETETEAEETEAEEEEEETEAEEEEENDGTMDTVSVEKTRSITDFLKNGADTCKGLDEQAYAIDCLSSSLEELANSLPETGDYADARKAFEKGAERLKKLVEVNSTDNLPKAEFDKVARPLIAINVSSSNVEVLNNEISKIYDEIATSLLRSDESSEDRKLAYKQISSVIMSNKVLLRSA